MFIISILLYYYQLILLVTKLLVDFLHFNTFLRAHNCGLRAHNCVNFHIHSDYSLTLTSRYSSENVFNLNHSFIC